jgi:LacI family transcriptional regulator
LSLKELARRLDLSVSTVSRALNRYDDISPSTRERALKAARELGYKPNTMAKRLAEGTTGTIAVVLTPPQDEFAPPMYLGYMQGIDDALQERGMDTLVTVGRAPPDDLGAFQRLTEGKRVDGIIFGRTRPNDRRIAYLLDNDRPFCVIGQCPGRLVFPYVDTDRRGAAAEAVQTLINLGHRHVALINTDEQFVFSQLARQGFAEGCAAAGRKRQADVIVDGGLNEGSGRAAADRLLSGAHTPTAFVCGNDLLAIGAMRAAKQRGLTPGRDVAVIALEDNQPARLVDPPLTAFSVSAVKVGRKAVELLLRSIAGEPSARLRHIFEPRIVLRGTHCAPPAG